MSESRPRGRCSSGRVLPPVRPTWLETVRRPGIREFMPFELASTGDRARVGVRLGMGSMDREHWNDVEVRRIGGEWYPVECRRVRDFNRHGGRQVAVPERP
jgi:hypothetical protein